MPRAPRGPDHLPQDRDGQVRLADAGRPDEEQALVDDGERSANLRDRVSAFISRSFGYVMNVPRSQC